ncbi:MAG: MATE family efflux transporter [Clostridiales bacterium]|mgnify:FL=1|nr:MATE family efflux transporter [Clostridiales bacterium]
MGKFRRTFIGDRAFYRSVRLIVVPVIIQHSVTNFVSLLDNIMVGQLGTAQMSGVAITNQLLFVFALCIFGGLSGPGIFTAQYYGAGDMEGLRDTFRVKLWFVGAITLLTGAALIIWHSPLIRLFLTGQGDPAQAERMLGFGEEYLAWMLPGLIPFALSMSYATTLRESGEAVLPMKAGIAAVLTNLVGNWLLIFGNLGFPALGVKGAAIATVASRFVELGVLMGTVARTGRFSYLHHVYRRLRVPRELLLSVARRGAPLFLNEVLWSLGMTALTQAYSVRALLVLSALNISTTVTNLFNVFFFGMGNAVAVLIGHSLGAGKLRKAEDEVWKLFFLSFAMCVVIGGLMAAFSPLFPELYNIEQEARALASRFILISAVLMPFHAVSHASYFTLRSGGSTVLTFLFDSAFTWLLLIPATWALVHWTDLAILPVYLLSQSLNVVKTAIGIALVRSGVWRRNIVAAGEAAASLQD